MAQDTNPDRPPRRKRGQRKPLTPEQQGLAEKFRPMGRGLSKPYKARWPQEWERFESAADLALVEAAESFDPARGVRFSTFARRRVVGALQDEMRKLAREHRRPGGDAPAPEGVRADFTEHAYQDRRDDARHGDDTSAPARDDIGHGTVLGATADAPVGHDLEELEAFEAYMAKLPAQHAAVCRPIFFRGLNQAQAAAELGLSQSRVSYLLREALAMLNGDWSVRPWGDDDAPSA